MTPFAEKIFAEFRHDGSNGSLADLSLALLEQQKRSWPQLIEGYEALKSVRLREVHCDGYQVFLQFNPRRIVSTGAKTDPASISQRKCFLCVENLPPDQKGVLYGGEFLMLCNPAPILDRHLTISNVRHIPQALDGHLATMVDLARQLSPYCTVFYNGPKCGASAPDHLHFQAGPKNAIPIEVEAALSMRRRFHRALRGVDVFTLAGLGRQIVLLEGSDPDATADAISSFLSSMKVVVGTHEEPMVNILCSYFEKRWRTIVFPRSKHRPDIYFKEGEERVVISPASVDIGGLIVTPVEKDFNSVDGDMVQKIFAEVSIGANETERIINEMVA